MLKFLPSLLAVRAVRRRSGSGHAPHAKSSVPAPAVRRTGQAPVALTALALSAALWASPFALPQAVAQPAGLPSMGPASSYDLSPSVEALLGNAIMEQGRRDPSYIHDPDVSQYLMAMGDRLSKYAQDRSQQIRIFGVRDGQINAFALPGGYIGVNSGLVVQSQSESELASVVAHEIGHVTQRHIARGMTQQSQTGGIMMASIVGALLAALAGSGDLAMGVAAFGQAAAIDQQLGFSRQAEYEADRIGFDMLTRAGYDPRGMVRMFNRLMSMSRLNESAPGSGYHSTHPQSVQRMSDIENRASRMAPVTHRDSDDFWYVRAKLRLLQARDTRSQRTAVESLQQEARQAQGVAQAAAWYGLAQAALGANDLAGARAALASARQAQAQSPYLDQMDVQIALREQGGAKALALADAAWQRWPDSLGLAFVRTEAMQKAGQHAQAIAFLQDCIRQWPDEPRLHEWLAQSYERNGDAVQARRAMATYYEMVGALPTAVSQLRQARQLTDDFYLQSELDTRIRTLRQRLENERELLKRFKS